MVKAARSYLIPFLLALVALVAIGALLFFGGESKAAKDPGPIDIPTETSPEKPSSQGEDAPLTDTGEDPLPPLDESLPPPSLQEAKDRRSLVAGLRQRFSEVQLKAMAQASVAIEEAVRAIHGDSELAYEEMEAGWKTHCENSGITEAERDALEDEAIRKKW